MLLMELGKKVFLIIKLYLKFLEKIVPKKVLTIQFYLKFLEHFYEGFPLKVVLLV